MGRKKYRRIEAVYNGKGGTPVTEYKVVDENGNIEFQGTYSECYYVMFPDAERNWMDKDAYDEAWNNPR